MSITIYDVARECGVSISTVSKVINNKPGVGDSTKLKVLSVMKKLKFIPSKAAIALSSKRSYTIQFFVPNIANPFFGDLARKLSFSLSQLGYSLIISNCENDTSQFLSSIQDAESLNIDGLIISSSIDDDSILRALLTTNIPKVLLCTETEPFFFDTVVSDDYAGTKKAVDYLFKQEIDTITIITESKIRSERRLSAFIDSCAINHMHKEHIFIKQCGKKDQIDYGESVVIDGNYSKFKRNAFFTCTDLLAAGVLSGARKRNLSIPQSLTIISYDGSLISKILSPSLTSIVQPITLLVDLAVSTLLKRINNDKNIDPVIARLMPTLHISETTK